MTIALNQAAQAYAEELAAKGQMAHATNLQQLGQGENLAWAWSSAGANANYASSTQQDRVQSGSGTKHVTGSRSQQVEGQHQGLNS